MITSMGLTQENPEDRAIVLRAIDAFVEEGLAIQHETEIDVRHVHFLSGERFVFGVTGVTRIE
jgi:hypothetical protein